MAEFGEEIDFNDYIRYDNTVCKLCMKTWLGQDPRCLPCGPNIHIFCFKCLEKFWLRGSRKIYRCPTCEKRYNFPANGLESILRLDLFENDKFLENSRDISKLSEFYNEDENIEENLSTAKEFLSKEEKKLTNYVKKTTKDAMKLLKLKQDNLNNEIKEFYNEKLKNLDRIITNFQKFSLEYDNYRYKFESDKLRKLTKYKMQLINNGISCLNTELKFFKDNDDLLKIGYNSIIDKCDFKNPIYDVKNCDKITNMHVNENSLYLITKKRLKESYEYNFHQYDTHMRNIKVLFKWFTVNQEDYKFAVRDKVYLLIIDDNCVQQANIVNNLKMKTKSVSFESFCRTKNDCYYYDIFGWTEGIVICEELSSKQSSILKLKFSLKKDWQLKLPKYFGRITDLRISKNNLIVFCKAECFCIVNFDEGCIINCWSPSKKFLITPSENFKSTQLEMLQKILAEGFYLKVKRPNSTYLALVTNDNTTVKFYKKIFDIYDEFDYQQTKNGFVLYFVLNCWINILHIHN